MVRLAAARASCRAALEPVTALYLSALTWLPVARGRYAPGDAVYHRQHGGVPGRAPKPELLVAHDVAASPAGLRR